ncbi:MAG TPA: hypothetical protein VL442_08100 [Mucilaginibacter sp.]|jgi:hypothetical protein|nr:hypothetical protein [Mucilaginibacter sp.]
MKKLIIFAILPIMISMIAACYNDNLSELTPASGVPGGKGAATCDTSGVMSYSGNVVPVLQTNCGLNNSCHSANNSSGYNLSTYAGVRSVALNGMLNASITWSGTVAPMPQGGSKISSCNIIKIQKWINAGSANN